MTTTGDLVIEPPSSAQPTSAEPVIVGSLCTGIAGLDLGIAAALGGACLAWTADHDPDIARFLAARFPQAPNLGDLRTVDWRRVEPVDVLTAGVPCQDVSAAGPGIGVEKGARSGVWTRVITAVRVLRPRLLVMENVAALRWRGRGLATVLGDLASAGYDTRWRCLGAGDLGAAHRRDRLFLIAYPGGQRRHPRLVRSAPAARTDPPQPRRPRPHRAEECRRLSARAGHVTSAARTAEAQHWITGSRCARYRREALRPSAATTWGQYAPAIQGWEQITGRAAPPLAQAAPGGGDRLSPVFVEWLMGFEEGWVTDPALGLTRTAQLRALGNAVVPLQAETALRLLTGDEEEPS